MSEPPLSKSVFLRVLRLSSRGVASIPMTQSILDGGVFEHSIIPYLHRPPGLNSDKYGYDDYGCILCGEYFRGLIFLGF